MTNPRAAACYGTDCSRRGKCLHYAEVEMPGEHRVVLTCRTPEGKFPLFVPAHKATVIRLAPVDGEGSEAD